jgi:hypothetical protein
METLKDKLKSILLLAHRLDGIATELTHGNTDALGQHRQFTDEIREIVSSLNAPSPQHSVKDMFAAITAPDESRLFNRFREFGEREASQAKAQDSIFGSEAREANPENADEIGWGFHRYTSFVDIVHSDLARHANLALHKLVCEVAHSNPEENKLHCLINFAHGEGSVGYEIEHHFGNNPINGQFTTYNLEATRKNWNSDGSKVFQQYTMPNFLPRSNP